MSLYLFLIYSLILKVKNKLRKVEIMRKKFQKKTIMTHSQKIFEIARILKIHTQYIVMPEKILQDILVFEIKFRKKRIY